MPIVLEKNAGEFEKPKDGTQRAVIFGVWDVGVQIQKSKDGEKERQTVVIGYEIGQKYTKGENEGKPMYLLQKLTASLYEKAKLRSVVEAILQRPLTEKELQDNVFEEKWIIGKTCLIAIEDGWVKNVMPMMEGLQPLIPTLTNYVPKWITTLKQNAIIKGQTLSEMNQDNPADDFYNGTGFNENPVGF